MKLAKILSKNTTSIKAVWEAAEKCTQSIAVGLVVWQQQEEVLFDHLSKCPKCAASGLARFQRVTLLAHIAPQLLPREVDIPS